MTSAVTISGQDMSGVSNEQLLAMLGTSAAETKANTYAFGRFSGKDGTYTSGAEDEQVEIMRGTEMVWSILGSNKNWICWVNKEPKDFTEQYSLFDTLPPESSLAEHGPYEKGEGWTTQFTLHLYDPAKKQEYMMKFSATSQKKAVGELIQALQEEGALHDLKTEAPVIRLGAKKFKAQGHSNWKPDFEIVKWVKLEDQFAKPQAQSTPGVKAIEAKTDLGDDDMKRKK